MFAAIGDTGYDVVLLLHILTVIATFGMAMTFPLLAAMAQRDGELVRYARWAGGLPTKVFMVASILSGVFGGALIGMSDDAYKFGQTWIWLGILLWIVLLGIQHAVLFPAERKLAGGDTSTVSTIQMAGSAESLILLVLTVLMVFKPGF